jgi:hypothetical protein
VIYSHPLAAYIDQAPELVKRLKSSVDGGSGELEVYVSNKVAMQVER